MQDVRADSTCKRIIACGVFSHVLEHLSLRTKYPGMQVEYLPPSLHVEPARLHSLLSRKVEEIGEQEGRTGLLYGNCFPGMDDFCSRQGICRAHGSHCYEMLLGGGCFSRLMEETAGTFFAERELLQNFEQYCAEPLELHDAEVRSAYFTHYERLLYVRQPGDPDLERKAGDISMFLGLTLEIVDADYPQFERVLGDMLRGEEF